MASAVLCGFNSNFDRFAVVSKDNRLKIYDSASGNLLHNLVEPGHLSFHYTCLTWGNAKPHGADAGQPNELPGQVGVVAVGTEKGFVVIWDARAGEIVRKLGAKGEGHTARVNDAVFNSQGTFLFTCSNDKRVFQWNVETGEVMAHFTTGKQAFSRIALSPDGTMLATGGTAVKLWDLSSRKALKKFTGHAKAVRALRFTPDGRFLLSTSGDRFINLWNCEQRPNEDEEISAQAVKVFSCGSNPITLEFNSFRTKSQNRASYNFLALTDQGEVDLWQFDPSADLPSAHSAQGNGSLHLDEEPEDEGDKGKDKKKHGAGKKKKRRRRSGSSSAGAFGSAPIQAETKIKLQGPTADKTREYSIVYAAFADKEDVVVVHTDGTKPVAVKMKYTDDTGAMIPRLSIDLTDSKDLSQKLLDKQLNKQERKPSTKASTAKALGPADMAMASPASALDVKPAENKQKNDKGKERDNNKAQSKQQQQQQQKGKQQQQQQSKQTQGEQKTLSLQETLEAIGLANGGGVDDSEDEKPAASAPDRASSSSSSSVAPSFAPSSAPRAFDEALTARTLMMIDAGETPKAESLQAVLVQALHTDDVALLESVLAVSDDEVIYNTVARLPSNYVAPFLTTTIELFRAKPARGLVLVRWIRCTLSLHVAYLTTVPNLMLSLSALYNTVDARVSLFKRYLKLSGRLDLVLSQIKMQQQQSALVAQTTPLAVYNEGDDDDDEDSEEEEEYEDEEEREEGDQDEDEEEDENPMDVEDEMEGEEDGEGGDDADEDDDYLEQ